ncbi:hypothetical protein [Oceanobacillus sp. J11TS1]|uniref:hypothetical protein n=1 Tax=Oceanobacillus sp. J11TS1 TaxID=2807191 RepID=UPI001B1EB9DB|nr:hypothetical protein [Oceanobacillus sp. J11TS1]GIO25358.1 hypothetical protein J11TS1_39390 [Oceanobacillus sp. J11TS1]
MEKIKLTQEQLEKIERELDGTERSEVKLLTRHTKCVVTDDDTWINDYKCLNKLSLEDMARILFIPGSYEVIPEFEPGDWVVTKTGYVGEIEFIDDFGGWANIGYSKDTKQSGVCLAETFNLDEIERHATPEEIANEKKRRFWKRLGRGVDEYRRGDIVQTSTSKSAYFTVLANEEIESDLICFPGANRAFEFKDIHLVVPVEQRLDK